MLKSPLNIVSLFSDDTLSRKLPKILLKFFSINFDVDGGRYHTLIMKLFVLRKFISSQIHSNSLISILKLGLNRERAKKKHTYQKRLTNGSWNVGGRLFPWNSLIWIVNLLLQLAVTTEKLWNKKNGIERGLKDIIEKNIKIHNIYIYNIWTVEEWDF